MGRFVLACALWSCLCSSGCVFVYTVEISNVSHSAVLVEWSQYHAKDFGGYRPTEFTSDLLGRAGHVSVDAGANVELELNDAGGGYWLAWQVIEPVTDDPPSGVLHLERGGGNRIVIGPGLD